MIAGRVVGGLCVATRQDVLSSRTLGCLGRLEGGLVVVEKDGESRFSFHTENRDDWRTKTLH